LQVRKCLYLAPPTHHPHRQSKHHHNRPLAAGLTFGDFKSHFTSFRVYFFEAETQAEFVDFIVDAHDTYAEIVANEINGFCFPDGIGVHFVDCELGGYGDVAGLGFVFFVGGLLAETVDG